MSEAIRLLARQRQRNRILAIGAMVLVAAAFGVATTLIYMS